MKLTGKLVQAGRDTTCARLQRFDPALGLTTLKLRPGPQRLEVRWTREDLDRALAEARK